MSKLIIPAAELIGTPLTTEELKSIMGGSQSSGLTCKCSYAGKSTSSIQNSLDACANWCSGECHKESKTGWTATYAGMSVSGS